MTPGRPTYAQAGERRCDDPDDRASRTEDVHVRSYAHTQAYDIELEIVTPDDEVIFNAECYLQPGDVKRELDALAPGKYEVRVTLDDERRETVQCRIGPTPKRTAVIEVGNGVLSLTQGLPTR